MSDIVKPDDELPRSPHHVLDELKSVLSNLGQHTEPVAPIEPVKETPPPPKPIVANSSSTAASAPASDADFWSGNVLGWPSGTDVVKKEPMPEPPLVVAEPAFVPPSDTAVSLFIKTGSGTSCCCWDLNPCPPRHRRIVRHGLSKMFYRKRQWLRGRPQH